MDTRPGVGAWEKTNLYFLSAMKARFLGRPARGLVAVPTKLSGSRYIHLTTLLVTHYMVSKGTVITAVIAKSVGGSEHGVIYTMGLVEDHWN